MRVTTRRLRAVLRIFHSLMDAQWVSELESELRWVAHLLGQVRDLDVLRERLRKAADPDDRKILGQLQRLLSARHRDAQAAMKEGLKSKRYTELIERLRIGALAPEMALEASEPPTDILLPMLARSRKKLVRAGSKLQPNDEPIEYHRVRKMAKHVRYATEALVPNLTVSDSTETHQFIKRLKKLQDTLGEHQDAIVAAKTVEIILDAKPHFYPMSAIAHPFFTAAKRLIASQEEAAKKARKKFPKIWEKVADSG